jgi:predicted LPLAT superfamily acyltransferase
MSQGWLRQRERGTRLALRLITWIALRLGRAPARALVYPICVYFLLFAGRARRASRQYLRRLLGRRANIMHVAHHFHCFGATILDRVFLLTDRCYEFDVSVHGAESIAQRVQRRQGCLLLGSHLGSFEILRTLGIDKAGLPINVLMYEDNAAKISELARHLNPALASTIIPIGTVDSMLLVKEKLDQGQLVGLLGDRTLAHEKVVPCQFLGERAAFPAGPMLLAAALKAPVFLCFGLYRGGNHYEIHCELLAERVDIPRAGNGQELRHWVQRYVERLEHYCHMAPYNWFNFYDFWTAAVP